MTLDRIAWFIGEVHRPLAILMTSISAGAAIVILACRIEPEGLGIAAYATAVLAGLAGLYGWRSWENAKKAKYKADETQP